MPDRDLTPFLGQRVQVVIDRPLGTHHPRHPDIRYPVNYGYLPGTLSGDGAPIDAYVLGVDAPVATFAGVVIAVVVRADDVEDKLVVAPADKTYSREEIAGAVAFQEKYFTSRVIMVEAVHMPHPRTNDAEDIEIITATVNHWQAVRDIRLAALLCDPQAFGSTYAENVARPDDDWRARVSHATRITFLALAGQTPVGIGGALHEDDAGDPATGQITSLFVTPEYRQLGLGRRLMQAALADLERDPALSRAILHVRRSQLPAQRLYASLGFVPIGEEDGEIIMARPLPQAPR